MKNHNEGSSNSRRGTKNQGKSLWRGRGWSPVRKTIQGNHNFIGMKSCDNREDPIGYKNLNRQWVREDQLKSK